MKRIIGACIGDCAHIAGVHKFLKLAEDQGYETIFLGPAVSNDKIIEAIREYDPEIVGLSYRLTPDAGIGVLKGLKGRLVSEGLDNREYILGGLPDLVEEERHHGFFKSYFQGDEIEKAIMYLKNDSHKSGEDKIPPQNIIKRIDYKSPFPALRHHFGLPSIEDTYKGISAIAQSECLDVISLGTDQNCQANFFHPERMSKEIGAGGVPVRSAQDFRDLYEASRIGNYPLMRTYAGSDDLTLLADLYLDTINNAWTAIPIFWFNQMDGRGPMSLEESIIVHLEAIDRHAKKDVPVEILESHHWSMRDAPDEIAVASGLLGAIICKELGVKDFISQYMFNTPPLTSGRDDLAKMLAQKELIENLADDDFSVYTQTRTGLFSYPIDMEMAKAQLAQSTMLQMQLHPDIVHVVSYSEANHAATSQNVIESCRIVKQVVSKCIDGQPDMTHDPYVIERKEMIRNKALGIIRAISDIGDMADPAVLYECVSRGILHAPQLDYFQNNAAEIRRAI